MTGSRGEKRKKGRTQEKKKKKEKETTTSGTVSRAVAWWVGTDRTAIISYHIISYREGGEGGGSRSHAECLPPSSIPAARTTYVTYKHYGTWGWEKKKKKEKRIRKWEVLYVGGSKKKKKKKRNIYAFST